MAIKDWPQQERPREKLLASGAGILSDAELLAIFLRTGVTGKSAVDLARELLVRFGGLRPLLEADRQQCRSAGMNGFLAKPLVQEDLREVLSRWLGGGPSAAAPPS